MIHRRLPDGRDLMDREALAQWLEVPVRSLPLSGAFVRDDAATEEPMYDARIVQKALAARRAKAARRGPRIGHLLDIATRRERDA